MSERFSNMMWAYKATFKQTDVGGGDIRVNITITDRSVLEYGMIGKDDNAGALAHHVYIVDSDGDRVGYVLYPTSIDNVWVPILHTKVSATVANEPIEGQNRIVLGAGDVLVLYQQTSVQNDELTINLRMLIGARRPAVTTTGSGGTVTTTLGYNKVI